MAEHRKQLESLGKGGKERAKKYLVKVEGNTDLVK